MANQQTSWFMRHPPVMKQQGGMGDGPGSMGSYPGGYPPQHLDTQVPPPMQNGESICLAFFSLEKKDD